MHLIRQTIISNPITKHSANINCKTIKNKNKLIANNTQKSEKKLIIKIRRRNPQERTKTILD